MSVTGHRLLLIGSLFITTGYFIAQTVVSWSYFEKMSRWNSDRAELISFLKNQRAGVLLTPELWLETDILINTQHYAFTARGAQSAVSSIEQHSRMVHAALILGYSQEGFLKWVHTHSLRFYHMLYATKSDFSSTYFYDPTRAEGLARFKNGDLPDWDWQEIDSYLTSNAFLQKKLDMIVLHKDESEPASHGGVIFENEKFIVYKAAILDSKKWGNALPSPSRKYPLDRE